MSWRERLQAATFRGVSFLIEGHDASGGRRLVLHEYPFRDGPYAEDLGRKRREFTVEAYVLASVVGADGRRGSDYMAARDSLLAALESGDGIGELVHPYLGRLRVAVRDYRLSETSREGGKATFSITFVEAEENRFPAIADDTQRRTTSAADATDSAAINDFASRWDVDGLPEFHLAEMEAELGRTLGGIERLVGGVTETIAAEIRAPYNMGAAIIGSIATLSALAATPLQALRLYQGLFDAGDDSPTVPTTTTTRRQQAAGIDALHAITQRGAVAAACRQSAAIDYASRDDALAIRAELLDALDIQMEGADDDTAYQALAELRTAVAEDLRVRGARLPQLRSVTPGATLPALVLAYQLHGDAEKDADLISRNKIRHPGFVPGGVPLEVLNG